MTRLSRPQREALAYFAIIPRASSLSTFASGTLSSLARAGLLAIVPGPAPRHYVTTTAGDAILSGDA